MTHTVTLIPGDGIGPAITDAVIRILSAAGAPMPGVSRLYLALSTPHNFE